MWLVWLLQGFQLQKSQEQLKIQNDFISICVDTYMKTKKRKIQKQSVYIFSYKTTFSVFQNFFFLKAMLNILYSFC